MDVDDGHLSMYHYREDFWLSLRRCLKRPLWRQARPRNSEKFPRGQDPCGSCGFPPPVPLAGIWNGAGHGLGNECGESEASCFA